MSHTPGPWRVQTHYGDERLWDGESDTPFSVVLPENGSYPEDIVCEVWGTEHDDEANARLIAAAPMLLEVLRQLDRRGGLGLDVHDRISAAIAMATGDKEKT